MQFTIGYRLARSLAFVAFEQRILQESYKNFLCNPQSYFLQKTNRHQFHHLCQSQKNLPPKLYSNSFPQVRLECSLNDGGLSSGNIEGLNSEKVEGTAPPDGPCDFAAVRQELDKMRGIGMLVPEIISDGDLEYYSTLTSKRGRKKFLSFLFKREGIRKKEKMKKIQKNAEREKNVDDEDLHDTLPMNRILRRITAGTMLAHDNWKLASAMRLGPQIAFDFSFDEHMVRPEIVSMVSQLTHVLNANKMAVDPFYMHWTGLKEGSPSLREMKRMFGDTFQNLMVDVTNKDVLDLFPRDKLIYLTADSGNIMHTFDTEKVYIVGGLVDARTIQTGLTLAKAKRYNISHARFPLDLYLQWELGAKTLTLDQVARILHSLHKTQDWTEALKNVPTRKHGGFKVAKKFDQKVTDRISTRRDLERYYDRKKDDMSRGRGRKESVLRDESRFSFSRAKREFKWKLLEPEVGGSSAKLNEEKDGNFDPTGDTLFSSSETIESNQRGQWRKKGSKWFQG